MSPEPRLRRSNMLLIAAAVAVGTIGPAAVALQPRPGADVAVLFAPSTEAEQAFRNVWRADGLALAHGAGGALVIARDARAPGQRSAAAFHAALRAAGALLILDGAGLGALCKPIAAKPRKTETSRV